MNPGGGATDKFTTQIHVDFIPDEVLINVENYYNPGGDAAGLVVLYSDIVNDNITSFKTTQVFRGSQTIWKLDKQIKGSFTFSFQDVLSQPYNLNGDIHLVLDFIKYKQKGKIL